MQGTVRDAMSTSVVTVGAETSLLDAQRLQVRHGVSDIYVVDADNRLLGVVPDYELLKSRLLGQSFANAVATLMSPPIYTTAPEAPLVDAAVRLRAHVHRQMPVVEGDRLIGCLTRTAVLAFMAQDDASETDRVDADRAVEHSHQRPDAPHFLRALLRSRAMEAESRQQ